MGFFTDKRYVITGGSSGIGLATARVLVEHGARVSLWARSIDKLQAAATDLDAHHQAVDVSQPQAVQQAMTATVAALGGLDGVIHAAGVLRVARFTAEPLATWDQLVDINLKGAMHVAHNALPHLDGGSLVFVASMGGHYGMPEYAAYNASKAGVISLAQALDLEYRGRLHVMVINPGLVETPMLEPDNRKATLFDLAARVQGITTPQAVAGWIVRGIQRQQVIVNPPGGRLVALLGRLPPPLARWVARLMLRLAQ